MACCSSKGRVPARRLRRKLQRENQTVGLDFFFFGKLRVLVMHLGSRYTLCLPAPELSDDLAFNITRALKECGLTGKAVTFRLDNEASLVALVERTARHRACPASAVITDVVPGYRPQSKGSIEKQVDIMKSGFWAIWLDLEAQINKSQLYWARPVELFGASCFGRGGRDDAQLAMLSDALQFSLSDFSFQFYLF